MKIKILGVSGSPRKGNTEILVQEALRAAEEIDDVKTEFETLRGKKISPCLACYHCVRNKTYCIIKDDMQDLFPKIAEADGLILGTPVYFHTVSAQLKAFMDRTTWLVKAKFFPEMPISVDFSRKVGGAIAVGFDRHGGVEHALAAIIHYFLSLDMIVVSGFTPTSYIGGAAWTMGESSLKLDAVKSDSLGIEASRQVGKRVAETARIIKMGLQKASAK
ncbi:MAG: flavodoxin family protein [Candidatus Bathyarchaeia archaeon]